MKYTKVSLNVVMKDLPILTRHVTVLPPSKVFRTNQHFMQMKLEGIQSNWHTNEAI